jgi:GNAT superfamily N-acetyltransferase
MSADFAVRIAAPEDVKQLVALCEDFNAHSGLPTGRLKPAAFRAAMFGARAFMTAHVAVAKARRGALARMIGYALSHESFTTDFGERGVYVVDIFVAEGWRRSGVATGLLGAVAAAARRRGASHLWWASMPKNFPARRFYASLGASDEPVHSHALLGAAFDDLARRPPQKRARSAPRAQPSGRG